VEISSVRIRPEFSLFPIDAPVVGSLCIKAKGGHRYRIKTANDGQVRVFIIDTQTGDRPKTPCGPDEDDD
jgi:hypothetical protein